MAIVVPRPAASITQRLRRPASTIGLTDGLALGGVALWALGLALVDLTTIDDLGLVSSLPAPSFAGLALFAAGLAFELRRAPLRRGRLVVYLVVLVVMLDGLPAVLEDTARVPTGWIHAGFVDQILNHGEVLRAHDARFSWPGMFSASGLAAVAGGDTSAVAFLRWTPVVLDLVYLLPLSLIMRSCTRNERVRWLALTIFVIANWVEADYFSPQGVGYIAYLAVLGVVLSARSTERALLVRAATPTHALVSALRTAASRLFGDAPRFEHLPSGRARAGVVLALTVVMAGLVVTHQLTPYALVIQLVVVALWDRLGSRALIAILGVLAVGYLSLGAQDFWQGQLSSIVGTGSLQQSIVERTDVSGGHRFVVQARVAFSGGLLVLGAVGALVRRRHGATAMVPVLALAPFSLGALSSYGGEVFVRAFFFALPFLAILVAELVVWLGDRRRVLATWGTGAALALGCVALLLTRYGNEPYWRTKAAEVAVVDIVQTHAADGATVAALSQNLPWRFTGIDRLRFVSLERVCGARLDVACAAEASTDYLIVTAGQRRYAEAVQGHDPAEIAAFEQLLPAAGYRLGLRVDDARVYIRAGLPELPAPAAQS